MEEKKNYEKLIKALQIVSIIFILGMLIAGLILVKKYDISVSNAAQFKEWLNGSVLTVALIIIAFTFVKAFALVITPSIVFVVSGIVFEKLWVAIVVNMIAIAVSITIPYYLGRFTGKGMADTLKNRFPKIKKFDEFAEENGFMVVFLIKVTGLIPSDASSMIIGAMGIDFKKFFLATNLGEFPLIVLWSIFGHYGKFSDPKTILYIVPVIVFAVLASFFLKWWTNKKSAAKAALDTPAEDAVTEEISE